MAAVVSLPFVLALCVKTSSLSFKIEKGSRLIYESALIDDNYKVIPTTTNKICCCFTTNNVIDYTPNAYCYYYYVIVVHSLLVDLHVYKFGEISFAPDLFRIVADASLDENGAVHGPCLVYFAFPFQSSGLSKHIGIE